MKNFLTKLFPLLILLTVFGLQGIQAQVTMNPPLPTATDQVVLTFNATGTPLENHSGNLYAHTGVTIAGATNPADNGRWKYVIGSWGVNTSQPQWTSMGNNIYELVIEPSIRAFYGVPENLQITEICLVIRSANQPYLQTSPDIFLEVVQPGLTVTLTSPLGLQPIYELNQTVTISGAANNSVSLTLFVNEDEVASTTESSISYAWLASEQGRFDVLLLAEDEGGETAEATTYFYVRGPVPVAQLPQGVMNGINYIDETTVTLVLHDPPALKEYVFAIGDFNDWEIDETNFMKRTPDGTHFWVTLSDLTPNTEYAFQYYIDGELRLADPYTHKVLDPWHDHWIPEFNYPNLKPYPTGKTNGIVSVMHPGKPEYQWQVTDFTPPAPEDMVIYELLIRDFVDTRAIKTVQDSLDYLQNLGVNVIELMPINEFEGNSSWGYNPSFFFATDKAYGTINDYKEFIDECHSRGIAVVIDMVLNHSFGQSPLVQMYAKDNFWEPAPENPWYNEYCPHEPWCWGADFDHLSPYTQEFVDRVNEFWLTEFKVDGFRFDFTKGFTNVQTGNQGWDYDAVRVGLLKRMADHIWSVNPNTYVILEHFTANNEEKELAEYGMLIWANHQHYHYQEAAMGWITNSNFQNISYKARGWDVPHMVGYMESHDEERMMYKNINFGNSNNPQYNIKDPSIGLRRAELAATFFLTIPGPKMIWQFGELGYDYSINYCPHNGQIDDGCRTDPKPVRWDYYDDWRRKRLYDVYSLLGNLKTSEDVFRTEDFSLDLGGNVKRIHLNHPDNKVTIIGNFGIEAWTTIPNFQQTGTWYEYFSGQTLNVTNTTDAISLQPGEYRLYSTMAFPDHGLPLSTKDPLFETAGEARVFPNPSAEGFWFEVPVNTAGKVTLEIFNLQGQQVYRQEHEAMPGTNTYFWNGFAGAREKAGLYFYRLSTGRQSFSGRLIVR
jgi:glycosidase